MVSDVVQAKFLVDRQDVDLWAKVLTDENPHKRELVDQVHARRVCALAAVIILRNIVTG